MVFESVLLIIFVSCLGVKFLTETYLSLRNQKTIQSNRDAVPGKFAEQISLSDHQKACDYSRARAQMGHFSRVLGVVLLLLWTLGGGYQKLDSLLIPLDLSPLNRGIVFFLSYGLIGLLLNLPLSLYSTFVIEEKFGFNKMTFGLWVKDLIKQLLLGLILGTPLLALILWLVLSYPESWWFFGFVVFSLFQLLILLIYPTFIAPLFNKFEPIAEGELKDQITEFLKKVDFPFKELFIMNASMRSAHGNAYFTGFGENKRIVFFDTLISTLTASEVKAVLAHEVGHFKKKHVLKNLIQSFLLSFLGFYIMSLCMNWPLFYTDHGVQTPNAHLGLVLFLSISGVYTFFLTPVFSYFSRKHEYEADQFAGENSSSEDLISALIKMYRDNASPLTPDPLFSKFYFSHPPAFERVAFLESLKN